MSSPFLLLPTTDKQMPVYPYSQKKYLFAKGGLRLVVLLIILVFSFISLRLTAQRNEYNWQAGINTGMLVAYSDIKTNEFFPSLSPFNELRSGAGLQLSYSFNPVFGLRAAMTAGRLAGANPDADEYFKANILDYSLQGTFNLNTIFFYDYVETPFDIYAIVGYGFVEFRSIRRKLSDDSFISAYGYAPNGSKSSDKTRELIIPVGIMLQTSVDKIARTGNEFLLNTSLAIEFTLINANTNKLDSNLSLREVKDKYSYLSIGLIYSFRQ